MVIYYLCFMQTIPVVILLFSVNCYIKLNKYIDILAKTLRRFRMTSDTHRVIDQLLGETTGDEVAEEAVYIEQQYKRERLLALAAGGQTDLYLGKTYSIDQIESFQESTITKLYARYEARLGSMMTKTLGRSALQAATIAASYFLLIPEENRPKLITNLEADPFVWNALNFAM